MKGKETTGKGSRKRNHRCRRVEIIGQTERDKRKGETGKGNTERNRNSRREGRIGQRKGCLERRYEKWYKRKSV